ncbi:MAG: thiamine phosphate synthase [Spirochaetaceae bacterium]|jgi:thiamine-phosphate pyrophosphorylase|nr:thiamine phosphate synthase [Spirochaetaceae bacterium]
MKLPTPILCLCTDRTHLRGRTLTQCVEDAVAGGVTIVQLREKTAATEEFYTLAASLRDTTSRLHVPLIINDRLDIALSCGADGLHIGQTDMPLHAARRLCGPNMIIGVSASTVEEARSAEQGGADYIGAGAVFPTSSKDDVEHILGLDGLAAICAAVKIPVVAIGGITADNARAAIAHGAAGVAAISAILAPQDAAAAAALFYRNLGRIVTG